MDALQIFLLVNGITTEVAHAMQDRKITVNEVIDVARKVATDLGYGDFVLYEERDKKSS